MSLLNRLRKVLHKHFLNQQYVSCIQPCFDYAISVWGSCSDRNKSLLIRLQRRAARIVTGNFDYITTRGSDLVTQLGWQTLDARRDYFLSSLMYRCVNGMAPARLMNELVMTEDTHDRTTRSATAGIVQVPRPNVESFRRSFKYRGAVLWNALPNYIKDAGTPSEFKYLYKKHYFT